MFQWLKNGIIIPDVVSSTLTFTNITLNDGAEYTCMVSNAAGSENISASLLITPEIVQQPQAINTMFRSSASFICLATGYPSPEYRWDRVTSSGVALEMTVASGSELTFVRVTYTDAGYYRCVSFIDGLSQMSESEVVSLTSKQKSCYYTASLMQ